MSRESYEDDPTKRLVQAGAMLGLAALNGVTGISPLTALETAEALLGEETDPARAEAITEAHLSGLADRAEEAGKPHLADHLRLVRESYHELDNEVRAAQDELDQLEKAA